MRLLVAFYDKNILENITAALCLSPDILMLYYDPKLFTHQAVYNTYLACRKYVPYMQLEVGTYDSMDYDALSQKLSAYLAANDKEDMFMDITGGNALTSAAAYECSMHQPVQLVHSDIYGAEVVHIHDRSIAYGCRMFELSDVIEAGGGKVISFTDAQFLDEARDRLLPMAEYIIGHVRMWSPVCTYFQRHAAYNRTNNDLHFEGRKDSVGKSKKRIPDEHMLHALQRTRMIRNLRTAGEGFSFDFRDKETMGYLASYGVWLELLTYYAMKSSEMFHDVCTSLKIDWNRHDSYDIVGNEIDTTAMYGCIPVVISCKMSENATDADAVNELFTVSQRISPGYVIRVLVTFSDIKERHSGIYLKAREMGIIVIDRSDILKPDFAKRLERAICHKSTIIR